MKLSKYISKRLILRGLVFVLLILAAWLFDNYRSENNAAPLFSEDDSRTEQVMHYIFNPVVNLSIKPTVHKIWFKKSLPGNLSRGLIIIHSARTFHILKAELPEHPDNLRFRNLLAHRPLHVGSSDDQPPLA